MFLSNSVDMMKNLLAASGGYVTIIKLLLAHGAEINSRTGSKLGISPLVSFSFFFYQNSQTIPKKSQTIPQKFPKISQKILTRAYRSKSFLSLIS